MKNRPIKRLRQSDAIERADLKRLAQLDRKLRRRSKRAMQFALLAVI
jgi:hypothetical protein